MQNALSWSCETVVANGDLLGQAHDSTVLSMHKAQLDRVMYWPVTQLFSVTDARRRIRDVPDLPPAVPFAAAAWPDPPPSELPIALLDHLKRRR